MKAWEIVGYTYDAAYHCVDCATKKFGEKYLEDLENADIYPVFSIDELDGTEMCDDCGERISPA